MPAFKHIGQLRGLAYLCLEFLPDGLYARNHGPRILFQSLHNLILTTAELPTVTHIIRMGSQDYTRVVQMSEQRRYAINSHLLRILFCFGNIETLSITSPVEFDISNSTPTDAARAWPRLKEIELKLFLDNHPRSSRLTVHALRK
jgi:hypothetical protein